MDRQEAIKVVRDNWPEGRVLLKSALEILIPELKESEDKIMKELIFNVLLSITPQLEEILSIYKKRREDVIAWLEKQGEQEQLYIRFGEIPTDEKSKIYQGEIEVGTENGVSVYPAFKTDEGDIVLGLNLPITKTTLYTQQHLIEYDDRPCYLVKGDYIGKDTDGQPLINNVSIVERIDSYRVKEEKQGEWKPVDKSDVLMSLDEAIAHCKEKSCGDNACALEHKQLEKWLIELKELKKQNPVEPVTVVERDGEQWVRVCALGEDFIIAAHDYKDGDKTKFTWEEACKIGTFNLKQGYIILALLDDINAKLKEIGGKSLDSSYWSSSKYSSYGAWYVGFGSGSVDINGKCYSHVVRKVIAF